MPPARTRSSTSCASAHSPATATSGIAASRRTRRLRAIASSSATRTRSGSPRVAAHVVRPRRVRRQRQRHLGHAWCRPPRRSSASPGHHRRAPAGARRSRCPLPPGAPAAVRARVGDRHDQPVRRRRARAVEHDRAGVAGRGPCLTAFSASGSSNIGGTCDVGQRLGQPPRRRARGPDRAGGAARTACRAAPAPRRAARWTRARRRARCAASPTAARPRARRSRRPRGTTRRSRSAC